MFAFKFDKALQGAAYLLRREPSSEMNYMRLLKILYIADRESIRQTGRPITGDRTVAMDKGPVLSETLELIKGSHILCPKWVMFVQRNEYKIRLVNDPGQASLSRFDIEMLERIAEEHRSHDEWDLVNITHDFAEWKKNKPEPSSVKSIPFSDILQAVGRSPDPEIDEDARTDRLFTCLFGA